jgi:excisionase family DNA binding protein
MIKATANCTRPHSDRSPSKTPETSQNQSHLDSRSLTGGVSESPVMKIGEVAQRFNLSLTTIRRATERGTLSCFTLPSGHRRFRQQDVLSWLGVEQEEVSICAGIPIAAVIRVSSDNQARPTGGADKSSLQHQEDRVRGCPICC